MLVMVNLFLCHPGKSPWKCLWTAKEGRPECAGREQLLGISIMSRECWFCCVPAMAVLCLGQAEFKPCCSRGSAHGAPLEKPGRNPSLRGA